MGATADNVLLAYIKEDAFGVKKTGANLQKLRKVSESLKANLGTTQSNEITGDRQLAGIKKTSQSVGGGINYELSYGTYDDILQALLMSAAWKTALTVQLSTLSADAEDNSFNDAISAVPGDNDGDGEVTGLAVQDDAPAETWTITCTSTGIDAGTFSVVGSVSGAMADASVGVAYDNGIIAFTIADGTVDFAESDSFTIDVKLSGLSAGEWVKMSGFTTAANNGMFRVESVTANKIVVSGGTLVDEDAGDSVTITQLSSITNGSTVTSFNMERTYTDLSQDLVLFLGVMLESMTMTIVPEQIITGAFNMVGKTYEALTASAGSGYTDETTTDWMNATDEVLAVLENQVPMNVTQLDLSIVNNLRQRLVIGELGAVSMGAGQFTVTGTLQAYYESKTLFNKFLNQTATQLAFILQDTVGNTYIVDMPAVKYSDGTRNATGKNTDIIANMPFTAYKSSFGHTLKICRLPAA